jgi:dTDP-4-dehydrorhamnose reductase
MKVAVIGFKGMLGSDLVSSCQGAKLDVQGLDLPEFDIRDFKMVIAKLPQVEWVVNCAAYTRVDDAESHREDAFAVNADGAHSVAHACARRHVKLLHISTDYLFDGRKSRPYTERDSPNPMGVYGASKLAGEKAVRAEGGQYLVVRTQSLFGVRGPNFVRSIARQLKEGTAPLRVVRDQVSSPTYTRHLADALVRLILLDKEGVVHVAASGSCSWFDFAKAIAARVRPGAEIVPISAGELARPAPRPDYSVLDTHLFQSWTGQAMPPWERGLDEYLAEEKLI